MHVNKSYFMTYQVANSKMVFSFLAFYSPKLCHDTTTMLQHLDCLTSHRKTIVQFAIVKIKTPSLKHAVTKL